MENFSCPTFTIIGHRDENKPFAKHYWLDSSGELKHDCLVSIKDGVAKRTRLDSDRPYQQLATIRDRLPPHLGIVCGQYDQALPDEVPVRLKGEAQKTPGAISRSKEYLSWGDGPGMMVIDCDGGVDTADELLSQLESVSPGITQGYVLAQSSSAGLTNTETAERLKDVNRWHLFILVQDGTDVPRCLEVIHKRLIIHGHGWVKISKAGSLLERSVVDIKLRDSNQTIFGRPRLGPYLERRCDETKVKEGPLFDTRSVTDLSRGEVIDYEDSIKKLRAGAESEHSEEIAKLRKDKARDLARRSGIDEERWLEKLNSGGEKQYIPLEGGFRLTLDSGEEVTVNELLANPEKYHEETCPDPFEPELGDCKAKIYTDHNPRPLIHSFAHGEGRRYMLKFDIEGFMTMLDGMTGRDVKTRWAEIAARGLNLEGNGFQKVCEAMSKHLGVGINKVKRELKREMEEVEAEVKKEREEHKKDEAEKLKTEAEGSGLLVLELDELKTMETIEALQRHLGNPESDDPVMQVGGKFVVVREQMIDPGEPPLPLLEELSVEGMRQKIEKAAILISSKGEQVPVKDWLGRQVIKAERRLVPNCVGIYESPFVRRDGGLVASDGYDKATGLFLRLTCGDCTPTGFSREDAQNSFEWLKDNFLEGFKFAEKDGPSIAIAGLLSAVQRGVLKECPVFCVEGAERGAGKTALCQIIEVARSGRTMSVTPLPENEEEIEKRLVATILQGRSCLVFDNVREGRKLSSESISACVTTGALSGRILGQSAMTTFTAKLLIMMTGINVNSVGDFNTRMLKVRLVGKEGASNKRDLDSWVKESRAEILRHVLTIVGAYVRAGCPPLTGFKKSRFPGWDEMVRKPIIWAGGEDCNDAWVRNETEDTEHSSQVTFVKSLYHWQEQVNDGNPWMFREVVKWCESAIETGIDSQNMADMWEAFEELKPHTKQTVVNLGRLASSLKGRYLGGVKLVQVSSNPIAKWHITLT